MSRQAARKKKSTKATVAHTKPAMLWLVLGILGGLVLAGLIYLKQNHQALSSLTHHQKHHTHLAKLKHDAVTPAVQNDNTKPQFDFYNILSGQKESVHHAEAHAKPAEKPVSAKLELPAPQTTSKSKAESSSVAPSTTEATVAEKSEEPAKMKTGYVLQLASVKSYSEADKLKAQLTMLGYDVSVQKSNRDHQVTYRVILGPYPTVAMAQGQQSKLRKSNISSIIIKTG
jgi:cell division protein FtsN